jgi:hypothetical protein
MNSSFLKKNIPKHVVHSTSSSSSSSSSLSSLLSSWCEQHMIMMGMGKKNVP